MRENFFDEQTVYSRAKSLIVDKYFSAWANIIKKRADKMAYLDLFSGPGKYKNDSESTPLLVVKKVLADKELCKKMVMIFNDKDKNTIEALEVEVNEISGIEQLTHKPEFCNEDVVDLEKKLSAVNIVPTLSFIDPFGYKGLTEMLIHHLTKGWGCDCIFFFNYERVRAAIANPKVECIINLMFGERRADRLRVKLKNEQGKVPTDSHQEYILKELSEAFKERNPKLKYFLPFRLNKSGHLHMLIFVSKNFTAYDIMKGIMAGMSTSNEQGVDSFTFKYGDTSWEVLFGKADELYDDLIKEFVAGTIIAFKDLYKQHSVDKPYVKKNYKKVLMGLEKNGRIEVIDPEGKWKARGTLVDSVRIKFLQVKNGS